MSRPWTAERLLGLFDRLDDHADAAFRLRHDVHAEPRVGGQEEDTTRTLLEALGCPDEQLPSGGALVRIGDGEGPAVGLRAELDALPMQERSAAGWSSRNEAMHACGHDVHMAAAYAVARTLQGSGTPAPLVLTLQPREEVLPSGAEDIALSPEFAKQDIGAFVGVHVQPRLPQRHFAATAGPVNAAADQFSIELTGEPGHGAYPHLTDDPSWRWLTWWGHCSTWSRGRWTRPTRRCSPSGRSTGGALPTSCPPRYASPGSCARSTSRSACGSTRPSASRPGHRLRPRLRGGGGDVPRGTGPGQRRPTHLRGVPVAGEGRSLPVASGDPEAPGLHHPEFLPSDETVMDVARAMLAGYLGGCSTLMDLPALTG